MESTVQDADVADCLSQRDHHRLYGAALRFSFTAADVPCDERQYELHFGVFGGQLCLSSRVLEPLQGSIQRTAGALTAEQRLEKQTTHYG